MGRVMHINVTVRYALKAAPLKYGASLKQEKHLEKQYSINVSVLLSVSRFVVSATFKVWFLSRSISGNHHVNNIKDQDGSAHPSSLGLDSCIVPSSDFRTRDFQRDLNIQFHPVFQSACRIQLFQPGLFFCFCCTGPGIPRERQSAWSFHGFRLHLYEIFPSCIFQ